MNPIDWLKRNWACKVEYGCIKELKDRLYERDREIGRQREDILHLTGTWEIPPELEKSDRVYKGQRLISYNTNAKTKRQKNYYLNPTEFSTQPKKQMEIALELARVEPQMDDFTKFLNILYFVQEEIDYITDAEAHGYLEHFQFSYETFTIRQGDCEDSSILGYDMAKYAGIAPNKVFVVYGSISIDDSSYGHAYLAYKDAVGTWFVGETTLDKPTPPAIWKCRPEYTGEKGLASWDTFNFRKGKELWLNTNGLDSHNVPLGRGHLDKEEPMTGEIDAGGREERMEKQRALKKIWGRHGRK